MRTKCSNSGEFHASIRDFGKTARHEPRGLVGVAGAEDVCVEGLIGSMGFFQNMNALKLGSSASFACGDVGETGDTMMTREATITKSSHTSNGT